MFKFLTSPTICWSFGRASSLRFSTQHRIIESGLDGDVEITQHPTVDFMWKDVCMWEDKPFMSCAVTGEAFKFGEARQLVHSFARYFVGVLGLQKGEVVAVASPNRPLAAIIQHAALEAGLVMSALSPTYTKGEILDLLKVCKASALIADPTVLTSINKSELNSDVRIVVAIDDALTREAIAGAKCQPVTFPKIEAEDPAILLFSSGTTGLPKGAVLTHKNCTSNLLMWTHPAFRFTRPTTTENQDVVFTPLPLYHCYGLNAALHPSILYGLHLVTMPKFTAEDFVQALRKFRPNGLVLVPPLVHMMLYHPDVKPEDLSSINFVVIGGAACPVRHLDLFREKVGKAVDIRPGYGMTELTSVGLLTKKDTPRDKIAKGTTGVILPGSCARVVDTETGQDLGPGEQGEILFKGPHVMRGYLDNEEATKETVDAEGWLHSGDVGYYDEDQYFYISDRTKDLIKVKAMQVAPTELENILLELPEISEAAVIGVPDERSGELPMAFVVATKGDIIEPQKVIAFVNARVARHKQLAAGVRIVDQIPKSATGKILRRELRKLVALE